VDEGELRYRIKAFRLERYFEDNEYLRDKLIEEQIDTHVILVRMMRKKWKKEN